MNNNDEIEVVSNPFAPTPTVQMHSPVKAEGTMATLASREIGEVQGMVFMAKQFPRSKVHAMDRIINDCTRPKLADNALYSYAKGGTEISGASIRLAESIAQNWGNIDFGIKELEQSNGVSKVMAYAWDLETNTRQTKIFEIKHVRNTKRGSYKLEDSREIYELVANNGARRLRACILSIIPGDVIDAAVEQCERTLKSTADTSPEAIKKMVETFEGMGVSKVQLEKMLQRRVDTILPAQMVRLKKIYKSLHDGMATSADFFETEDLTPSVDDSKKKGVDGLKGKIGA